MAKVYTHTIQLNCWKEHTCIGCGTVYSYAFARKIRGKARTAAKAQAKAKTAAAKALASDVDLQPCPTCGLYQPDMTGQQRARRHKVVNWITLIALVVLLILCATDVVQSDVATRLIAGVCAVTALLHAAVAIKNPNSDPSSNRKIAQTKISAGVVKHTPGNSTKVAEQWANPQRPIAQTVALFLLAAAIVLAAAGELLRMSQKWPLNAVAYPPVVGPGDETRIYMDQSIHSVKGYWRGTPQVQMQASGTKGKPVDVEATANQNNWGSTINVKSDEKDSRSTPWVKLRLPGDAGLGGKVFDFNISLSLQYPEMSTSTNFLVRNSTMQRTVNLHLAPAGAGARYVQMWWFGSLVAVALLQICGWILFSGACDLQRQATPTRIVQPQPAAPQ